MVTVKDMIKDRVEVVTNPTIKEELAINIIISIKDLQDMNSISQIKIQNIVKTNDKRGGIHGINGCTKYFKGNKLIF